MLLGFLAFEFLAFLAPEGLGSVMKCFDVRESIESVNALVRTFALFRRQSRISGFLDQNSALRPEPMRISRCEFPLISLPFAATGIIREVAPRCSPGFAFRRICNIKLAGCSSLTRDPGRAIAIPKIEGIQTSNLPGNIQEIIMGQISAVQSIAGY
jgi:hypothetical protein